MKNVHEYTEYLYVYTRKSFKQRITETYFFFYYEDI